MMITQIDRLNNLCYEENTIIPSKFISYVKNVDTFHVLVIHSGHNSELNSNSWRFIHQSLFSQFSIIYLLNKQFIIVIFEHIQLLQLVIEYLYFVRFHYNSQTTMYLHQIVLYLLYLNSLYLLTLSYTNKNSFYYIHNFVDIIHHKQEANCIISIISILTCKQSRGIEQNMYNKTFVYSIKHSLLFYIHQMNEVALLEGLVSVIQNGKVDLHLLQMVQHMNEEVEVLYNYKSFHSIYFITKYFLSFLIHQMNKNQLVKQA